MQLKEELTLIQCGHETIAEYLHTVKGLADEIAIIEHSILDDVTNPNAISMTNLVILQSTVLNFIHTMFPSTMPRPLLERITHGYLIWLLHIISRVIFPIC